MDPKNPSIFVGQKLKIPRILPPTTGADGGQGVPGRAERLTAGHRQQVRHPSADHPRPERAAAHVEHRPGQKIKLPRLRVAGPRRPGAYVDRCDPVQLRPDRRPAGAPPPAGLGPPVVLLHGFPQTSHQWRHQLPPWPRPASPAFAPDNRGFGRTDKPGVRVSRSLLADDVVRFLDASASSSAPWSATTGAGSSPSRPPSTIPIGSRAARAARHALHGVVAAGRPRLVVQGRGLAEEYFGRHHRGFIEVLFGGREAAGARGRPASPWPVPPGDGPGPLDQPTTSSPTT